MNFKEPIENPTEIPYWIVIAGGDEPTSGLVAVLLLRALCDDVRLFGLGRSTNPSTPYQYYKLFGTERKHGNMVHSFKAENWLLSTLSHMGLVTWCKPTGCYRKGVKVRLDTGPPPVHHHKSVPSTPHSTPVSTTVVRSHHRAIPTWHPAWDRAHNPTVPVKRPVSLGF